MHKKLESDLISLAHSILQMKNKDNVFLLKEKAKDIYEKLSLLAFVEEYVNATPNLKQTKEEVLTKIETALDLKESLVEDLIDEDVVEKVIHQLEEEKKVLVAENIIEEEIIEQPFDELVEIMHADIEPEPEPEAEAEAEAEAEVVNDVVKVEENKTLSLEEELQDTISVDEMATLFDVPAQKSLNDKLATNIQIGLNDRIVFVKNLFDGSQEDFNRVVSQLNTYATEKEAKKFLNKMVKPDYDWSQQEELETRFVEIIERKFA